MVKRRKILCDCGCLIDNPAIYTKCVTCRKIAFSDMQRHVSTSYNNKLGVLSEVKDRKKKKK